MNILFQSILRLIHALSLINLNDVGYIHFTLRRRTEFIIQPISNKPFGPNVRELHLLKLAANFVAELITHIFKYQNKHNSYNIGSCL